MRFWDASAVVPLLVSEPLTRTPRCIAEEDPALIVWWATRTECVSALARRPREGDLAPTGHRAARRILDALAAEWSEVLPGDLLRQRAERLLGVHVLRSADAMQLAAALVWCRNETSGHTIVCLDDRLREAASQQGFRLLPG